MKAIHHLTLVLVFLFVSISYIKAQVKDPHPIFKNGEAQVVPEFQNKDQWIKEEVWVETSFDSDDDGRPDRMHVFVTRPSQTESGNTKLPVVYMSSPYYGLKLPALIGTNSKKYFWNVKQELGEIPKPHKHPMRRTRKKRPMMANYMDHMWVPRGYIMVYSSSPGTGLSDGAPTIGGDNEALAPKAVVDWLCGRAKGFKTRTGGEEVTAFWSTGKVGMTGTSYDGTLCLAAATTGVEGLEAIIPVAPVSSYYNYYRSNGLVRSPGGYRGEDMDVLYDFINSGDRARRKHNNARIRDSILVKNIDRVTGDYNQFWDGRDYTKNLDNMKAALLMSHGFNDWNVMPLHSFSFYKAAKEKGLPVQLYYHQDGHGGNPPLTMMNRWFTRYLHGVENGVENDPPVQIVREFQRKPTPYLNYPDPDAQDVILFLKPSGVGSGQLCLTQPTDLKNQTIVDDGSIKGRDLIGAEYSANRLMYVSPVLQQDLRISGIAHITVRMACDKPAANLSVWLVSLPWKDEKGTQIYEDIITRGWADPQNHSSIEKGEALVPGQFYHIKFDLMPDDQVIPKGQQIGLMIFSSDNEFTLIPEAGTELTVDPNQTILTLPVVGGLEEYQKAVQEH